MERVLTYTGKNRCFYIKDVKSSNIESIRFFAGDKKLRVGFKGGTEYDYFKFEAIDFAELVDAESLGKHFHKHIKGKFDAEKVV